MERGNKGANDEAAEMDEEDSLKKYRRHSDKNRVQRTFLDLEIQGRICPGEKITIGVLFNNIHSLQIGRGHA